MTLNITLVTPAAVFQSTDFRLSDRETGRPMLMPSTKAVPITYSGWGGFLTYAGVGGGRSGETSAVVQSWFLGAARSLSFDEAVERVRTRAYTWLHSVASGRRHSFILAGFVGTRAVAAIISNHERWQGGQQVKVSDNFFVDLVPPPLAGEARLIVTGMKSAVSDGDRGGLERLAREHSNDPLRIRLALANANVTAAQRCPNAISEDCFVQSLDQWGNACSWTSGDSRTVPASVFHGVDTTAMMRPLMDQLYGKNRWSIRQSASATDRSYLEPVTPCTLEMSSGATPPTHELVLLECPPSNRAQTRAVNAHGAIVGHATLVRGGTHSAYIWRSPKRGDVLGGPGATHGVAWALNDAGLVVGNYTGHAVYQACEWSPTGESTDLPCPGGSTSGALAINATGHVVGYSNQHPSETDAVHRRPVLWHPDRTVVIRNDLAGGEAIAINDASEVLVRVRTSRTATALLWRGDELEDVGFPNDRCRSFFPTFLTQHGAIVGTAIDVDESRREVRRDADGKWETIAEGGRSAVTCGNDAMLVGSDEVAGYHRAWVWPRGMNERAYLPSVGYHHTSPIAIGPGGNIVGTASADGCSHPILWRPL